MAFLPLKYAFASLTIWHLLIWLALSAPLPVLTADRSIGGRLAALVASALSIAVMYCWVAPIVGQLFGEKFSWAQVWPSGFVLAAVFSLAAAAHFSKQSKSAGIVLLCAGIPFFGLGMSAAYWALPRLAGWGLSELPKMPWGVSL